MPLPAEIAPRRSLDRRAYFDELVRHQIQLRRFGDTLGRDLARAQRRRDIVSVNRLLEGGWRRVTALGVAERARRDADATLDQALAGLREWALAESVLQGELAASANGLVVPRGTGVMRETLAALLPLGAGGAPVSLEQWLADWRRRTVRELRNAFGVDARGMSADALLARLVGTPERNFRDGLREPGRRALSVIVNTAINRASNEARLKAAPFADRLVWVSILDNRTCLVAGTLLETPDGSKPIETFEVGDLVIGGSGRPRRVLGTARAAKREMAHVTLSNGRVVTCTADHFWLTEDNCWTEARDLFPGLALASRLPADEEEILPDTLRPLRHAVHAEGAPKQVLQSRVFAAGTTGVGSFSCAGGREAQARLLMHALRGRDASPPCKKTQRQAGDEHLLWARVLRRLSHRAARRVPRLRRTIAARIGARTCVLFASLQDRAPEAGATALRAMRDVVYGSETYAWADDRCDQRQDMLARVSSRLESREPGAQAKDKRSVYRRESSQLAGRKITLWGVEFAWAKLAGSAREGAQAGRVSLCRLRDVGRRIIGEVFPTVGRGSHSPLPQLSQSSEGQPVIQSGYAMCILSQARGSKAVRRSDGPAADRALGAASRGHEGSAAPQGNDDRIGSCLGASAAREGSKCASGSRTGWLNEGGSAGPLVRGVVEAPATRVVSVELSTSAEPVAVYDIQVEHDHSFICSGVVLHNSLICGNLDGRVFPIGSGPRPPQHPNCRSQVLPVPVGEDPDAWIPRGRPLSYEHWLREQPEAVQVDVLGKSRQALFAKGRLPLNRFHDFRSGRAVRLDTLYGQHRETFERVADGFDPATRSALGL